ncbi:hypothetical protein Acr_28g0006100 [Actinidia rufa]|uniref:Uncharacterized protein n=1 Tax=Actinidia rufa TaxID=165716 RepID=A0A7J0HAA5_9ERIC|nr:hypothetical protein Acr_28g0006100 [Actinidia rufa]
MCAPHSSPALSYEYFSEIRIHSNVLLIVAHCPNAVAFLPYPFMIHRLMPSMASSASICEEIDFSESIPLDISEMKRVACFLSALPFSFDGVCSQILGAKDLPSFIEIFSRIHQTSLSHVVLSPAQRSAFDASVGPYRPPESGFGRSGESYFDPCWNLHGCPVAHQAYIYEDSMASIYAEEYLLLTTKSSAIATLAEAVLTDVSTSSRLSHVTLADGSTSQIDGLGTASLSSSLGGRTLLGMGKGVCNWARKVYATDYVRRRWVRSGNDDGCSTKAVEGWSQGVPVAGVQTTRCGGGALQGWQC